LPGLPNCKGREAVKAFERLGYDVSKQTGSHVRMKCPEGATRYGEDGMHIVRAGEFRRAVRWRLDVGSKGCEFVSLINSSAGNIPEEENREGDEKDSTNSQTHTRSGPTPEQERQIRKLVEQGMSEKWAREEVLGKGSAAS
jgi:hypothetical protein